MALQVNSTAISQKTKTYITYIPYDGPETV